MSEHWNSTGSKTTSACCLCRMLLTISYSVISKKTKSNNNTSQIIVPSAPLMTRHETYNAWNWTGECLSLMQRVIFEVPPVSAYKSCLNGWILHLSWVNKNTMFADLLPRFAAALRRLATGGPVHLSDLAATFEPLQLSADAPGTGTRVVIQPTKNMHLLEWTVTLSLYIYNYNYI